MDDPETIARCIEACFEDIARQRMAGIPILNQELGVQVVGLREWRASWLCILITPWCMNLMLLPKDDGTAPDRAVGSKEMMAFPAGQFEFIHGAEAAIGSYRSCSLFSPVFEFGDQETAAATAAAVLDELLRTADEQDSEQREQAMFWHGTSPEQGRTTPVPPATALTRRALLTGGQGDEERA